VNPYTEPATSMNCKHCGSPIRWVEGQGWAKPKDSFAEMGICAKRAQGHQLRDAQDYEQAAQNIWKALRSLDPHRAERKELAEAGVAGHTIAALLNDGFAALVPGLIDLFQPGTLDFMAKHKRFTDASLFSSEQELSHKAFQQYSADWEQWGACEEQWQLVQHIESILPRGLKVNVARQCSTYLWTACWYMGHAEQLPTSDKRTQWLVELIEYLLPDLFKRVNAIRRAQLAARLVSA
jgi:hypothetical protein